MQASAGPCLLLHLRCTSRGILQITGFTHTTCAVSKIYMSLSCPPHFLSLVKFASRV
jgi:hypothetical protein